MITQLLWDAVLFLGASGGVALGWYIRNSAGRVRDPKSSLESLTLMQIMEKGNAAVTQMAADVHKLYHPPDEYGMPCKCAYCEIRADDEPKPEPAPEPVEPDRNISPEYVRALRMKIDGLKKQNAELKSSREGRVVTKTVERESVLDSQLKQCAKLADEEQQPIVLSYEIQGRPVQVTVGPQREPDEKVVSFGSEVVRPIWHDRPQSGPGSKLYMEAH